MARLFNSYVDGRLERGIEARDRRGFDLDRRADPGLAPEAGVQGDQPADARESDRRAERAPGPLPQAWRQGAAGRGLPAEFPKGTSAALKLNGAPWRSVRDFLLKEMKDKPDNTNNRFALAARMNRLMSGGPFPFWGCSKKDELTTLSVKKSREHGKGDVPEYRIAEEIAMGAKKGRPQPVWKIAYAGAIGGQTMTGIPAIERLREKFPALKIWPFEVRAREARRGDARRHARARRRSASAIPFEQTRSDRDPRRSIGAFDLRSARRA